MWRKIADKVKSKPEPSSPKDQSAKIRHTSCPHCLSVLNLNFEQMQPEEPKCSTLLNITDEVKATSSYLVVVEGNNLDAWMEHPAPKAPKKLNEEQVEAKEYLNWDLEHWKGALDDMCHIQRVIQKHVDRNPPSSPQ